MHARNLTKQTEEPARNVADSMEKDFLKKRKVLGIVTQNLVGIEAIASLSILVTRTASAGKSKFTTRPIMLKGT